MAYIGNDLRSNEDYKIIDDISSGFNGSATSFALQVGGATPVPFPKFEQQLLISVNGVIQEPDPTGSAGFKLLGTNIVFSSAPTNGHAFFGVIYAGADYVNAGGTFPDGSINFPSITFSADTNTGFTRTASGTVALISDGTKVAQFPTSQGSSGQALITDGGGNLSFGVPTAAFTDITLADSIIHSGDTDTKITFSSANTIKLEAGGVERFMAGASEIVVNDPGSSVDFRVEGDTEPNLLFVDASEDKISIGTSSPSDVFDVVHAANTAAGISIRNTNNSQGSAFAQLLVSGGDNAKGRVKIEANGAFHTIDEDNNGNLIIEDNGTERIRLDSSGRLGIGTTSPTSSLHVSVGSSGTNSSAGFNEFCIEGGDEDIGMCFLTPAANNRNQTIAFGDSNNNAVGKIQYLHASDALVFTTNNSDKMRIDSSGRVGIGTTSPTAELEIFHATDPEIHLNINTHGDVGILKGDADGLHITGNGSSNQIRFNTNSTEGMRIDSSQRVLIGTTSSVGGIASHLQVVESDGGKLAFARNDTTVSAGADIGMIQAFGNDNDGNYQEVAAIRLQADKNHGTNDKPGRIVFLTTSDGGSSPTERMRIDSSGNVGIGTSSPQEILHVKAASETVSSRDGVIFGSTDSLAADKGLPLVWAANIGTDADYGIANICGRKENSTSDNGAGYLQFGTGNAAGSISEHMRLNSAGALLINRTAQNSDELFSIFTDSTGPEMIILRNNAASSTKDMITMMHVKDSGTQVAVRFKRTGGLNNVGSITTESNSTAFNTSSDYRLKENEVLISDGITRLKTLKPYRFNFKTEPGKTVDGFFAHEVTPVVPEAVTGEKDAVETTYYTDGDTIPEGKAVGDIKEENAVLPQSLDYAKFTPLLTAALQEEIAKREALEARVAALEAA